MNVLHIILDSFHLGLKKEKVFSIHCYVSHSTWRGERGGGGAFRLRGVVPPCTDEVLEGTWGGCVGVGGGSQTSRGQAQLKTGEQRKPHIKTKGRHQRGTKANEKRAAHKNNDLILENMHNMIGQSGP